MMSCVHTIHINNKACNRVIRYVIWYARWLATSSLSSRDGEEHIAV